MPYIGTQPLTGQFKKLDAISVVNGQPNYTLNYNGTAYKPATANALLVSVNGVIQAAGDAFNISGSTITFTENLVTGDVIDFIIALGDTGSAVTPVDGSVTTAKLANDAVTSDKLAHDLTVQTSLSVPTIKDGSGSNTAMTIDSSGRVSFSQRPYVYVDLGGTTGVYQTMSAGAMPFNTVRDGDSSLWSTTAYTFTCPVDGLYMVSHGGLIAANTNHEIHVMRGRSGVNSIQARFFEQQRVNRGSVLLSCLANDTIYWQNYHGMDFYNGTGANTHTFGTIGLAR